MGIELGEKARKSWRQPHFSQKTSEPYSYTPTHNFMTYVEAAAIAATQELVTTTHIHNPMLWIFLVFCTPVHKPYTGLEGKWTIQPNPAHNSHPTKSSSQLPKYFFPNFYLRTINIQQISSKFQMNHSHGTIYS